ncbi:MAG TPA: tRNA lysidine(34) synthetase TilS, partial [Phototrophicaceae bacterium]|nr:tRNA lysidine(34) synthetase TilS [Phototrophicaceae bacterium]
RTSLWVIRPLLDVSRAEIEAYCAENDLNYRHDATNDEPGSLRNRLRLQIIPQLRELNPQIGSALHRLAQIASSENDFIEQEIISFAEAHTRLELAPDDSRIIRLSLKVDLFRSLHPALQRRFLLWTVGKLIKDPDEQAGFDQLQAVVNIMPGAVVGVEILLPGGLRVRRGYDVIYIEYVDTPVVVGDYLVPPGTELALPLAGTVTTPEGWMLHINSAPPPPWTEVKGQRQNKHPLSLRLTITADTQWMLRTRRPGDRIAPSGMNGHTRKLKDWLIDRKIPQQIRDHLPLLIINEEIMAILIDSQWHVTESFLNRYNLDMLAPIYINVTVAKT